MADKEEGSIAARCIHFARQGMIAFSYDMVGYNDTFFPDNADTSNKLNFYERHRRFANAPSNLLWNINLMGLQTWNSIRALDFLESLPDVDRTRLACTGESGGGTQTYILGAIDDRLATQAPVVMVSHTMQGGCSCENAPGLRIKFSNVEIAACAAPRPQIIVGATGDWTRDTTTVEGPAIEQVYKWFNAQSSFRYSTFDFPHNYNQTSREAVYDFFGSVLKPSHPASKETSYTREPDADLRVFPDGKLPSHAKTEGELISFLISQSKMQLAKLTPTNRKSISGFKQTMLPAWRHTLQVEEPKGQVIAQSVYLKTSANYSTEKLILSRKDRGDRIPALLFSPLEKAHRWTAILVHPEGKSAFVGKDSTPVGLVQALLAKNIQVLSLDTFLTGEAENHEVSSARKQADLFFTTYNVTDTQARVQDILTASAFITKKRRGAKIAVCGMERAGLWALLASPGVDAVVADCNQLDVSSDDEWLQSDLFVPGLRKLGGFETVTSLAVPNPAFLHNTGTQFSTGNLNQIYALHPNNSLTLARERASSAKVAEWIASLK
jgi:dienelactone hydrolase